MSLFSPAHHPALIDQFWIAGSARCPHDGSALASQFHPHTTGYLLALACHLCGKKIQVTRYSDPHRFAFRPWTPEEIELLVAQVEANHKSECPICNTGLRVRSVSGQSFRSVECLRCGNMHYFPFASLASALSDAPMADQLAACGQTE